MDENAILVFKAEAKPSENDRVHSHNVPIAKKTTAERKTMWNMSFFRLHIGRR